MNLNDGGFHSSATHRSARLRTVTLSHLTNISAPPSAPAQAATPPVLVASSSTAATARAQPVAGDPFLALPPSGHVGATALARTARDAGSGVDDGAVSNVAKWSAFGLNTSRYAASLLPPHATPQQSATRSPAPLPKSSVSVSDSDGDDGEVLFCGSSLSSLSSSPLLLSNASVKVGGAGGGASSGSADVGEDIHLKPLPTMRDGRLSPAIPPHHGGASWTGASQHKDTAAAAAMTLVRQQLSELSARVKEAQERERCGPPKPSGVKGGGGLHSNNHWRSKKKKAAADDERANEQHPQKEGEKGKTLVGRKRARDSRSPATTSPARADPTGHTATATTTPAVEGPDEGPVEATRGAPAKTRGKRAPGGKRDGKRAKKGEAQRDPGEAGANGPQWRSLFPFGGAAGAGAPLGVGSATSGKRQGHDEDGSTASAVPFTLVGSDDAVRSLFLDVEAALNDPDRIQAPPLFVGIVYTNGESNFTLSGASSGKALLPSSCATLTRHADVPEEASAAAAPPTNPRWAHRYVRDVVVRWRDRVFVLAAQRFGFPFLLRVLRELVGVELITFDAPALLLALLCSADGDVFSHCISDVRVMAWMASLTAANSSPAALGGGKCAGEDDSNGAAHAASAINTLVYDYGALMEQYGGHSGSIRVGSHRSTAALGAAAEAVRKEIATQRVVSETFHLAPLYRSLYGVLGAKGLLQAFLRQEKRIPMLIASMKRHGIRVNMAEVQRFKSHCLEQMSKWRSRACAYVPELPNFNIQSPDQVRVAMYEVLQLGTHLLPAHQQKPADGRALTDLAVETEPSVNAVVITKNGKLSTAEETLRLLGQHHEFPRCVLHYRKCAKVLQTYVDGMMSFAIPCEESNACAHGGPAARLPSPAEGSGETKERAGVAEDPLFCDVTLTAHPTADNSVPPSGPADDHSEDQAQAASQQCDVRDTVAAVGMLESSAPPLSFEPSAFPAAAGAAPTTTRPTPSAAAFALLHPNFVQEGTDTGRLSCVEPNLQNLPRTAMADEAAEGTTNLQSFARSINVPSPHLPPASASAPATGAAAAPAKSEEEDEFLFRRCFRAPTSGHVLLSVDFQQIELRVLAHLCGDAALIEALTGGNADIHRSIAEILFKKTPVSVEERNMSKRVVFGVLYGAGPRTLASQMGVSVERAVFASSLLRSAFPKIHSYHQKIIQQGREDGFVRTISGRIRQLPDINSAVMGKRAYAERQAFNTVVQGSAADVMKMAMLAVERDVLRPVRDHVQLLMQIHDEMIFSVAREKLPLVVPLVTRAMSRAMSLLVPLTVTAKFGPSLGELEEWTVDYELGLS